METQARQLYDHAKPRMHADRHSSCMDNRTVNKWFPVQAPTASERLRVFLVDSSACRGFWKPSWCIWFYYLKCSSWRRSGVFHLTDYPKRKRSWDKSNSKLNINCNVVQKTRICKCLCLRFVLGGTTLLRWIVQSQTDACSMEECVVITYPTRSVYEQAVIPSMSLIGTITTMFV